MPTITGTDNFSHASFSVPGGGSYIEVNGAPSYDTSILTPGMAGALLLDSSAAREDLGKNIPSPGAIGWQGAWWRLTTEPASQADVFYMWKTAFAGAAGLTYVPSTDQLQFFMSGSANINVFTVVLNTWYWLELIWDVSSGSHTLAGQINGSNLTSLAGSGSASNVEPIYMGQGAAATQSQRFGDWRYGTAASTSDFLGVPTDPTTFTTTGESSSPVRW